LWGRDYNAADRRAAAVDNADDAGGQSGFGNEIAELEGVVGRFLAWQRTPARDPVMAWNKMYEMLGRILFVLLGILPSVSPETLAVRPVCQEDIPRQLGEAAKISRTGGRFTTFINEINQESRRRIATAERDHLIYYLLQSGSFTRRPRIEPAISAAEYVGHLDKDERMRYLAGNPAFVPAIDLVPEPVKKRIREFLRACRGDLADERLSYLRGLLPGNATNEGQFRYVCDEYSRAMRFLYEKELAERDLRGAGRARQLASLYQRRGYSTDTRPVASFAVWQALSVLKSMAPEWKVRKVLVVGPGLDFAPWTSLMDNFPPQSYQPFALADALLETGLAEMPELKIHCVDVNDRVLDFFRNFPARQNKRLYFFSRLAAPEFRAWFDHLGSYIGTVSMHPQRGAEAGVEGILIVEDRVARIISAGRLNVITERYDPSPGFDLVIATNVLLYFNNAELALALSNIHSMMRDGACFVHNEFRDEVKTYGHQLGLKLVQARTIRLAAGNGNPLYDGFVIQRRQR